MTAWRNLGLGAGLLLALSALQSTQPGYAEITRPAEVRGEAKTWLQAGSFDVEVTGYKAAKRVQTSKGLLTTDGIWVLVGVNARATSQSMLLGKTVLQGPSGARYDVTDRMPSGLSMMSTQRLEPGLTRSGVLVFEIPEDQLAGATLRLAQSRYGVLGTEAVIVMPPPDGERRVEEFDLGL